MIFFSKFNENINLLIQHQENGNKGSFFIETGGDLLAEMVYSLPGPGIMTIDHTEVDDSLKGKNIGSQLLNYTVDYARKQGLRIKPYCSFARSVFEKRKEEFKDVWIH